VRLGTGFCEVFKEQRRGREESGKEEARKEARGLYPIVIGFWI
jgi:hypothetical protein